MKIEHIAIWVNDLEAMRTFYTQYFNGEANSLYHNKTKQFESYFITFESGARLEIMRQKGIEDKPHLILPDMLTSLFLLVVKKM